MSRLLSLTLLGLSLTGCGDVVVGSFDTGSETGDTDAMSMAMMVGDDRLRALSHDGGLSWPIEMSDAPDDNTVLHAVGYANGRFVAVGGNWSSRVETSVDGETWEVVYADAGGGLRDLVHTGTRWIAVGKGGEIMSSDDGLDWQTQVVAIDGDGLWAVASDGGQVVVAVGSGDVVASFDGGVSWLQKFNDGKDHSGVAFDGVFVVVDEDGETHIAAENIATWSSSTPVVASFKDLIAADGAFWAPGSERMWSSPDGMQWTSTPMPMTTTRIAWSEGVFLGVTSDGGLRSDDGQEWALAYSNSATPPRAVTFGPSAP